MSQKWNQPLPNGNLDGYREADWNEWKAMDEDEEKDLAERRRRRDARNRRIVRRLRRQPPTSDNSQ